MKSVLYIIATPIGNLSDISLRAVDVLREVDVVLAEDSRVTRKLLNHFEIDKDIVTYNQHTIRKVGAREKILNLFLTGKKIALVSDAGTPGISDPGNELIDFLYKNLESFESKFPRGPRLEAGQPETSHLNDSSVQIIPIPGASSVSAALSVCGFDVSKYVFLGFWPKKKHSKLVGELKESEGAFVFFESPYRLIKTMKMLAEEFGDRRVFVARELTKMYEETYRGEFGEVVKQLEASNPKGEVVVVVEKARRSSVPGENRTSI